MRVGVFGRRGVVWAAAEELGAVERGLLLAWGGVIRGVGNSFRGWRSVEGRGGVEREGEVGDVRFLPFLSSGGQSVGGSRVARRGRS